MNCIPLLNQIGRGISGLPNSYHSKIQIRSSKQKSVHLTKPTHLELYICIYIRIAEADCDPPGIKSQLVAVDIVDFLQPLFSKQAENTLDSSLHPGREASILRPR